METSLRRTLRSLCCKTTWNYAVFWKLQHRSRMVLTWEDGYYDSDQLSDRQSASSYLVPGLPLHNTEKRSGASGQDSCSVGDQIGVAVAKMSYQIFSLGEGIIGRVASTGKHDWIFGGRQYHNKIHSPGSWREHTLPQCPNSWQSQFAAGIKTIAVIAVMPHGVVQLGSTRIIMESSEIVEHVKGLFCTGQRHASEFVFENTQDIETGNSQRNNVSSTPSFPASSFDPSSVGMINQSVSVSRPKSTMLMLMNLENVDQFVSPLDVTGTKCLPPKSLSTLEKSTPLNSLSAHFTTLGKTEADENRLLIQIPNKNSPWSSPLPVNVDFDHNDQISGATSNQTFLKKSRCQENNLSDSNKNCIWNSRYINDQMIYAGSSCQDDLTMPSETAGNLERLLVNQQTFKEMTTKEINETNDMLLLEGTDDPYRILPHPRVTSCSDKAKLERCCSSFWPDGENTTHNCLSDLIAESFLDPGKSLASCSTSTSHLGTFAQWVENRFSSPGTSTKEMHGHEQHSIKMVNTDNKTLEAKFHHFGTFASKNHNRAFTMDPVIDSIGFSQSPSGSELLEALGPAFAREPLGDMLNENILHEDSCNSVLASSNIGTTQTLDNRSEVDLPQNSDTSIQPLAEWFPSENSCADLLDAIVANVHPPINYSVASNNLSSDVPYPGIYIHDSIPDSASFRTDSNMGGSLTVSDQQRSQILDFGQTRSDADFGNNGNVTLSSDMQNAGSYNATSSVSSASGQVKLLEANCEDIMQQKGKKLKEISKTNRKRARPGESSRPRPKDRQQIQDRVKELRELIPNGAKCSIDALLERTIKHMMFLQGVTKYADKLKHSNEPKAFNKDTCTQRTDEVEGGASWAFELGGQSVQCPIVVENLNQPRQMLVEMLCEERGLFLEIADIIRRLGLTILKGIMEVHDDKVWAHFIVEANRDVHRVEILWSLMQLLQPCKQGL